MDHLRQILPDKLTGKIIIDPEKVNEYMHEGHVVNNKKNINLTIGEGTEKQLSKVREHFNLPDNLTAATWAISLFFNLLEDQKSGNEIRMRGKDGRQYRVDFPTRRATSTD